MTRNVLGSVLALIGAAAVVWSPFGPWYNGRHGEHIRIDDLFHSYTGVSAGLWRSLLLPMAFAGLVTLIGLLLRSRSLVTLAGLVALGFTVLWMVRQGLHSGSLVVGNGGAGLDWGIALALGGGLLLLIAAAAMSGRHLHAHAGRTAAAGGLLHRGGRDTGPQPAGASYQREPEGSEAYPPDRGMGPASARDTGGDQSYPADQGRDRSRGAASPAHPSPRHRLGLRGGEEDPEQPE